VSGWTDAHCHLQDRYLRAEDGAPDEATSEAIASTLARASAVGVDRVVVIGTDAGTSREAVALAEASWLGVEVFSTVGLHPHDAVQGTAAVAELARRGSERLVGIGECGLDYHYEHSPRDVQRRAFAEQIALAHELDLALVVHARDAWDDLFDVLTSEGVPTRTVIHCFTGGPDEAARCLDIGCDLSISGVVTFKNAQDTREAVVATPLDRLHVETDSPFLAPVPHRGRPNEPAFVALVGEYLAGLLKLDAETVRSTTAANTSRLFNLPQK
jgi:TatD DNase family protein